jgi:hypothetical protein
MWSDDPAETNDDYLATDIDLLRRTPQGWEVSEGGGGSNWPFDPPLVRPVFAADRVVIGGEVGSGGRAGTAVLLMVLSASTRSTSR